MISLTVTPKPAEESSRNYAYRLLYDSIMSLELTPGTTLVDAELSEALGISRTPIREAVLSLQEARLVEIYPQRSSCVSHIDLDAVEEGIFLRFNVERAILRDAVDKASGKDLMLLRENLAAQERCLGGSDLNGFVQKDNEFHMLLYQAAGKPWAWQTVRRIVTHLDRVRRMRVDLGQEVLMPAYEEHCRIYDTLITHSHENMDDFLYDHLTSGYRTALPELMRLHPDYFAK